MGGVTLVHDAAVLAGAVYGFQRVPPTVAALVVDASWVVVLWVVVLAAGALLGIAGAVGRVVQVEVAGCALMASGLLVYAAAVFLTPTPSATAGFLLAAAACAVVLRGFRLLAGAALTLEGGRGPDDR